MNIIYLDTLFFINCITDYFTLLCTGKICGAVLNRIKIGAAAAVGGLYACLCVFAGLAWLSHPALKLVFAVLLCLIAYGSEEKLLRCCVTFLAVSASFGGILSALALSSGGVLYLPMDFKALLVTFAAAYWVLSVVFRRLGCTRSRRFHEVTVQFLGSTVHFTALQDTGNELYDPISNAPVLICHYELLTSLFPGYDLRDCQTKPYALFEQLAMAGRRHGKLRLIPYHSVGGQGMLVGFKPDAITIDGAPRQVIVAMTDRQMSHDNTYQGIF